MLKPATVSEQSIARQRITFHLKHLVHLPGQKCYSISSSWSCLYFVETLSHLRSKITWSRTKLHPIKTARKASATIPMFKIFCFQSLVWSCWFIILILILILIRFHLHRLEIKDMAVKLPSLNDHQPLPPHPSHVSGGSHEEQSRAQS